MNFQMKTSAKTLIFEDSGQAIVCPLDSILGKGSLTTYKIIKDQKFFALKIFNKELHAQYLKESRFQKLSHPRLVTPHLSTNGTVLGSMHPNSHFIILTELCPNGDLFSLVLNKELKLTPPIVRGLFRQILDGIEYMHSQKTAHLDLKLENIFLDSNFHVKIGDFDHSFMEGDETLSRGTVDFRAPEVIKGVNYDPYKADVFSSALVLFVLLNEGGLAFQERMPLFQIYLMNKQKYWNYIRKDREEVITSDFMELFEGMIHVDPKQRFGITEIRESAWFKGESMKDEELTMTLGTALKKEI
jgi:serine/threonine protein kinase